MEILNQPAPEFSLVDQNGKTHALRDYRGSFVVVYFYPKALTPGCTTQACGIRDSRKNLEKQGIVVLGISPDEPAALKRFEEKEKLNFTLLSDPDHQVAKAYGAYGEKNLYGKKSMGILRQSFIVDHKGVVRAHLRKVKTATHHEDIIEKVAEIAQNGA